MTTTAAPIVDASIPSRPRPSQKGGVMATDPTTPGSSTTTTEMVTPAVAEQWLEMNKRNRPLRRARVRAYARDMQAGNWRFTGEAIKFASDGALLDGQNRLHAVIAADMTVPMLIVRGLADEAQEVMDAGAARSASDAFTLHDEKNTAVLAALCSMILDHGDSKSYRTKRTNAELLAVLDAEPRARQVVNELVPPLQLGSIMTPAVSAFTYWRLDKLDAEAASRFFGSLSELVDLPAGSPVLALHHRLLKMPRKSSVQYRLEALALVFSAWNAWRRGENRIHMKLPRTRDGKIAVPEPV